ncbi:microtubule organization protein AKNA [Pezoporus wallicus]|uniref:microtubule organization protein AKNA n=1 Tax=Pezoporus wallicus TaxID=35540 RepID=UPI00254D867F|nr:microtubule organization protein AKNA [Pezoporus wallicus]
MEDAAAPASQWDTVGRHPHCWGCPCPQALGERGSTSSGGDTPNTRLCPAEHPPCPSPPSGCSGEDVTYIHGKDVPSLPRPGHEAAQVMVPRCPRAMASPAPWLHRTQTQLRRWQGEEQQQEEEEEEDDGFQRQMDEYGVIGLGDDAGSPPWGHGEDLEERSPVQEGRWHPQQNLVEEDEDQSSFGGDEEPWGAESDGDPYPELSYEGQWGSGLSSSPEPLRGPRALCQPHGCSTDGGDTSGLTDASPGPPTPSQWDAGGGHRTPKQSILLHRSTEDHRDATSTKPVPSLTPTRAPQSTGDPPAPRGLKKAAPKVLPPRQSLDPRRQHGGSKKARNPSGMGTSYGQGQLNHPLPDLSKVEARVKVTRSYRPPRGRALPSAPGPSIGFKSPAEIVREVLLSSGEGVPPQPPPTAGLPHGFRSPEQATELVQQLQDDYHKLLTKYAEAENTIDQLRLGARVSLYSDPPQPSRSLAMGAMGAGGRVLALSMAQARTATFSAATVSSPGGAPAPPEQGGAPQPSPSPTAMGGCPTCLGTCCCPGTRLTRTLAGQAQKLQAQVDSFEGWTQAGKPTRQEQLQRFGKLKEAQDALEQAYLGARQHPGALGDFDPERAVEREIFHLGLHLEELKERLEPGGRQQLPSKCLDQPQSPPTPSPSSATRCPHPESPMVMDGPQGTAGDTELVTEGLPQPLWHKQQQVEDDFGDLLEQYKHFKSLPESLSLEQLSLAESRSQEEADGAGARDGGPSKVPCRTRSLEEGSDLETSPLHPLERRAVPLSPREPPWPAGAQGHQPLPTTEEPPSAAMTCLGVPKAPQAPLSRQVGNAGTQRRPHKEQRIVSPETDSGFVGSEASRVSPPVHTPEHRPPSTGKPGSLGPSIPIPATLHPPWKREVTPLPSETTVMDTTGGTCQPPSTPSQSSSPRHWTRSPSSEAGHDHGGVGTHTDSDVEGRSCASTSGPLGTTRGPASPPASPKAPSPTPLSLDPPSLDLAHCDLLGSRLERDQAIRELQDEVWRLRLRLEESLRHSHSYPKGKAPPRVTLGRRQPVTSAPLSPRAAAPVGEPRPPVWGRMAPRVAPTRRGRSVSVPRDRPELDLTSESDPSPTGPRVTPSPWKTPRSPPDAVTFRGQHTGTRYQAGVPRASTAPREEPRTHEGPRCRRSRAPSAGQAGDAARQPQHSTPRRTCCPACRAPMGAPSSDGATHAEHGPGAASSPGSHTGPRAQKLEQPGLWYLASPGASAAIGCLAPVPIVPYAPSVLYCSPVVPTSPHTMGQCGSEHPPRSPAAGPHRCLPLDLEELNWSLSRAMAAARSVRVTTTRMSRVLAAELSQARGLRHSCLF